MSRIGKKPIEIPSGVEATIKEGTIEVKGTLGSRHFDFSEKSKNLEPRAPLTSIVPSLRVASTPVGISIGFFPILDIINP